MLLLGMEVGKRVLIEVDGVETWVSLQKVNGKKIRLGFEAPQKVKILREEVIGQDAPSDRDVTSPRCPPRCRGFFFAPMEFPQCGESNTATAST